MAECGGCCFHVLAPHDAKLETKNNNINEKVQATYFNYFLPRGLQTLNYEGVWPAIKHHPLKVLLIPFLIMFFFVRAVQISVKERPDVIYAHWFTPQAIVAYLVSRLTGAPFFYTSHSSDVWLLRKIPWFGGLVVREVTRKAKGVTVVSKRTEQKLKSFFAEDEWKTISKKVSVIPMGVYVEAAALEENASGKDIVFIGRLAEKKGLQYLIPAFDRFASEYRDYRLHIAGVGPYLERVEALVAESKNSDRISLLGFVDGEDKASLIRKASCIVVPSIITDSGDAEGLPVSLLEGLSQGKPCVATKESGADDILIDGLSGILINQRSVDDIYHALLRAAGMTRHEVGNMKLEAEKVAKQFNWGRVAAKYKGFLEGGVE